MKPQIMYIELKSGFSHNGPAWIAKVNFSKSGQTIYFNDRAIKKMKVPGITSNHFDIETGEEYWVSGVKKNGMDRHSFGGGKIQIDRNCINEYLSIVDFDKIDDKNYQIIDLEKTEASRFVEIENKQIGDENVNNQGKEAEYWENNRRKLNSD